MRTFGKFLGRLLLVLIAAGAAIWYFGPYEEISVTPRFDPSTIGADIDQYLATQEARFDDITEDTQKRVIWRQTPGQKTAISIVYLHGFSATSQEIRPVPDQVAEALDANLVYTRLAGHGRSGEALAGATVQEWMNDTAEAIEIGRRVGTKVIVIATSTGATLLVEAALQPELMADVSGVIMISPNFRIADPMSAVLTFPAARHWVPKVAGAERSWTPSNDQHGKYWTTTYPTIGLMQMAALVAHARAQDYGDATVPALFWFSDADAVVDHRTTREISERWGGPVTLNTVTMGAGDDPSSHVIAGDVMSPGQNDTSTQGMVNWIKSLVE